MDTPTLTEQLPSLVRFSCQDGGADDETWKKSNRRMAQGGSKRRTKFLLEGVRQELYDLQRENERLRLLVRQYIAPLDLAEEILAKAEAPPVDIYLRSSVLMDEEEKFNPQSVPLGERKFRVQHDFDSAKDAAIEKKKAPEEATSPGIPRVLNVPIIGGDRKKECKSANFQQHPLMFHSDAVENLAVALSGEFAF